ncbi:unnamed protein product, partial [Cladocopium goreaui]
EPKHKVASLFAGVLGLELGLRPFVKVASYVEVSPFCRDVIKARIQDQLADPGPILEDISSAGNQNSMQGSRTILIREVFRLHDEYKTKGRPLKSLVLENVGAILSTKCRDCMEYVL